jgi:hypothetical protein
MQWVKAAMEKQFTESQRKRLYKENPGQGVPAQADAQAVQIEGEVLLSDEQIENKWRALQIRRSMHARKILEVHIGQPCPKCKSGKLKLDSNGYNEFMRCRSCSHVPLFIRPSQAGTQGVES